MRKKILLGALIACGLCIVSFVVLVEMRRLPPGELPRGLQESSVYSQTDDSSSSETLRVGYCTGDYVRVREKPFTSAEILGRVHKGNRVEIVSDVNIYGQLWYEINNPFGNGTAYIAGNYVAIDEQNPVDKYRAQMAALTEMELAKKFAGLGTGRATGDYVRVRAEPDTNSAILGRVRKGAELRILSDTPSIKGGQQWYMIENPFGGGTGWISAKYVALTESQKNNAAPVVTAAPAVQPAINAASVPSGNNGFDVPDFHASANNNLGYVGTEHADRGFSKGHTSYAYACSMGEDDSFAEKYVEALAGYPFQLINHEVRDYRSTSAAVTENWMYVYAGSKNVKTFGDLNLDDLHNYYQVHLTVSRHLMGQEGIIKFYVGVADGLSYAGASAFEENTPSVLAGQSGAGGSSPHQPSFSTTKNEIHELCIRCSGRKKIRCSACDGKGGREEYSHSPNYSGSTTGYRTAKTWHRCSKCYGNGEVDCPVCNGRGYTVRYN